MMDILHSIALGFATALTWQNLVYCFIGVFVGTVIGVLPGLGPVPTISLLLPFSFTMDVASAVILMAGIYYGAQYGGSITAILIPPFFFCLPNRAPLSPPTLPPGRG